MGKKSNINENLMQIINEVQCTGPFAMISAGWALFC